MKTILSASGVAVTTLVWAGLLLFGHRAQAQQEVYVDQFTGTAHVSIPLTAPAITGVSVPLGLNHSAKGVKVDDVGGLVGVNWALTGLPSISREVRGLADDVWSSTGRRYGWLTSGTGNRVNSFISSTGCAAPPCAASESVVLNAFAALYPPATGTNVQGIYDSEPDVFSYSVPGHAGKFVFDVQGSQTDVRTIPYDPIEITWQPANETIRGTSSSVELRIGTFTIETPEGLTYQFNERGLEYKTVSSPNGTGGTGVSSPGEFFKKEYDFMGYGELFYATSWQVTTIQNELREEITFSYDARIYNATDLYRQDKNILYRSGNGGVVKVVDFGWNFSASKCWLTSIQTPTTVTSFIYENVPGRDDRYLTQMKVQSTLAVADKDLSAFSFRYKAMQADPDYRWENTDGYPVDAELASRRRFLMAIDIEEHCANRPGYEFVYEAVNSEAGNAATNQFAHFPPPGASERDLWGYYKPEIIGHVPKLYLYPDLANAQFPGAPYRLFPIPGYSGVTFNSGPSANRLPLDDMDPRWNFHNTTKIGSLKQVSLPAGGTIQLDYEPHRFYDSIAAAAYYGPGTRIKEIRFRDHLTGVEQVRAYQYTLDADVVGSLPSGRLLHMPVFGFAAPYTPPAGSNETVRTHWIKATVMSLYDLSNNSFATPDLGYGKVTETVSGRGRTITTFALTGAADATQLGTGSLWHRSFTRFANRPSTQSAYLSSYPCLPGYGRYPFPPDANLNFRRGLPLQILRQAASGPAATPAYQTVQQTDYRYELNDQHPPVGVVGISYDYLKVGGQGSAIFAWAPYRLLTEVSYNVKQETQTVHDQLSTGQTITEATYYGYNARGLVAGITRRRGSGDFYRTRYKYLADYPYPNPNSGAAMGPLLGAQARRCQTERRGNDLVETISEILTPTSPTTVARRVTGASLNTFKTETDAGAGVTYTRPYQTWSWQAAPGLPATGSAYQADSVAIISATRELRLSTPRFQCTSSVEQVNGRRIPVSVEARSGLRRSSLHFGYQQLLPVLTISNALAPEVVFSNFEAVSADDQRYAFTETATAPGDVEAHTGKGCVALTAGSSLRTAIPSCPGTTLPNLDLSLAPTAFRLSFWANPAAAGTSLSITVVEPGVPTPVTVWARTVALPAVGKWQRYEVVVPEGATAAAATARQVHLRLGAGPKAYLDDVLLLPVAATAHSTTYNPLVGKTAEIDAGGRTTYYDYDLAGQVRHVRDYNKDIIQRTEQAPGGQLAGEVPGLSITYDPPSQGGVPVSFTVQGVCGTTYTDVRWDFGNGVRITTATTSSSHTFPASGTAVTYTVSVIVNTPAGPLSVSTPITIPPTPPDPLTVTMCIAGIISIDRCTGYHDIRDECQLGLPGTNYTRYEVTVPTSYQNSVTYQWYYGDARFANTLMPGETGPTLTVNTIRHPEYIYRCEVRSTNNLVATSNTVGMSYRYSSNPCSSGL